MLCGMISSGGSCAVVWLVLPGSVANVPLALISKCGVPMLKKLPLSLAFVV
jgi:hypothetical protein